MGWGGMGWDGVRWGLWKMENKEKREADVFFKEDFFGREKMICLDTGSLVSPHPHGGQPPYKDVLVAPQSLLSVHNTT